MIKMMAAAVTLLMLASPAISQTAAAPPTGPDFSTATPIAGTWTYRSVPGGSEAAFVTTAGLPQIVLTCTRVTRSVSLAKAAAAPAPYLSVWTSSSTRSLRATFVPATGRLTATLSAFDPLLDAMSFSRGRLAFAASGQPPLVAPSWGQVDRVVEDCRS